MNAAKVNRQAENHALACLNHLINKATLTNFERFIKLKSQESDALTLADAQHFVISIEHTVQSCKFTDTIYLPKSASTLDLNSFNNSSILDLVVSLSKKFKQ